ncbi:MAG: hypothetical protein ACRDWV_07070 [Acidimicrobiales bacterium]
MNNSNLDRLISQAAEAARQVTSPDAYEGVWKPLRQAAALPGSLETGLKMLGSNDPVIRATGCDLVGTCFNGSDAPHRPVADALVELAWPGSPQALEVTDPQAAAPTSCPWQTAPIM